MDDIITRLIDLPASVSGFTVRDRCGDYNIYLNSKQSREALVLAYRHELRHIRAGDFDRRGSADLIEIHAHSVL